jgi:hypothetical protein
MRPAETYRGARRNMVLRTEPKSVWGPNCYFGRHRANYGRMTVLLRKPSKYHPLEAAKEFLRSLGERRRRMRGW